MCKVIIHHSLGLKFENKYLSNFKCDGLLLHDYKPCDDGCDEAYEMLIGLRIKELMEIRSNAFTPNAIMITMEQLMMHPKMGVNKTCNTTKAIDINSSSLDVSSEDELEILLSLEKSCHH